MNKARKRSKTKIDKEEANYKQHDYIEYSKEASTTSGTQKNTLELIRKFQNIICKANIQYKAINLSPVECDFI